MKDFDCQHESFAVHAAVNRLTDAQGLLTGFTADVRVTCSVCGQPFVWLGVPSVGISLDQVTVSPDGEQLRCPIAPSYAWSGPGEDSPVRGFSVRRVS